MYHGITLNPEVVRLDDTVLEDALAVEIDRTASRTIEDWTDLGPHAGLVDCPELRTTVRITRRLGPESVQGPALGARVTLTFYTSPTWSDAGRKRVQVRCVITGITHRLRPPARSTSPAADPAAEQLITALAESTDGATDPVTVDDPPGIV